MLEIRNYAWTTNRELPDIENGHEFQKTNFMQKLPHTPIFSGKTGLRFVSCNMINCSPPPDAILEGCLIGHVSFCGNVHPDLVAAGHLEVCPVECSHVVETDEVVIDGQSLGTTNQYKDTPV